jgi:hypothetical protein
MAALTDGQRRRDSVGSCTFLPDGQISHLAVQPRLQKYFASPPTQINFKTPPSCPTEGRIAIVTDAGRDAVDAAASGDVRGWQGGSTRPVS